MVFDPTAVLSYNTSKHSLPSPLMPRVDSGLEHVQNLYLLQMELLSSLEGDLSDPKARRQMRISVAEFEKLLRRADRRYMGGDDVYESLKSIPSEVEERLKMRTK